MRYINEKLGVPDNIVKLAEAMYEVYLDYTKFYGKFKKLSTTFYNKEHIKIGDIIAPNFILETIVTVLDKEDISDKYKIGELYTIGFSIDASIDKSDFRNKRIIFKGGTIPTIKIKLVSVESDTDNIKLRKYFVENRDLFISSISHELMHFYNNRKKGYDKVDDKSDYSTFQKSCINLNSFRTFWHYMYFTSTTEEVVRSSEVAGELKAKNINKKDFNTFIKDNETYKYLQKIKNYTFEQFIEDIKEDILDKEESLYINDFLAFQYGKDINEIAGESIEYKLSNMIKLSFYEYITNKKDYISSVINTLEDVNDDYNSKESPVSNLLQLIIKGIKSPGPEMELRFNIADQIMSSKHKYKDNPSLFFKDIIKKMNTSAEKTLRKISKLYDLAEDDKSIKDWELHQAINNRDPKYINKYVESFNNFKKDK